MTFFTRGWQLIKNCYHWLEAHVWQAVYGYPDRGLALYGVTGTNGKTTTSYLLAAILTRQYGADKVGMLTTVALRVGEKTITNTTKLTTLPSSVVYRYLADMKKAGVTQVVLEVTSHALDQHRLSGLRLAGAIILNIAREHLDYHVTMERYARAKQRIIKYLKPGAPLVGKGDDEYVAAILSAARKLQHPVWEFSQEEAKVVLTPLEGAVNQENALAASLLARAAGIPEAVIAAGIQAVKSVPGRMEWIEAPQGFRVVIDYAVTPDALDRLYAHVRSRTAGRIFGVLGAAGLRDRGKRPAMAAAAAGYADELILTREDPWTEPEEQIFSDLEKGLPATHTPWQRIIDRREALQYALGKARRGDVIIATGKGAEEGMGIGKEIIPWNERRIIEEIIAKL